MHEWALANAIAETLESLAEEEGASEILEVEIVIGRLQSVAKEDVEFWLKQILDEKGLKVSRVNFVDEEVLLRCRRCGYEWTLEPGKVDPSIREYMHFVPEAVHAFFRCPRCGSHDYEVVKGRGISIGKVVLR